MIRGSILSTPIGQIPSQRGGDIYLSGGVVSLQWSDKKVLVTGAGGFIGSHLAEALVREGADTRAYVRYNSTGRWGWLDHSAYKNDMEVVLGDVCDRHSIKTAMSGCDIVFHLAALIGIPYSYRAPDSYVQTNIGGTLNVLQAAVDLGVEKLVHTSTSEVYGTARSVPIDEEHPLQGQSPYSASKIGADKLVESFVMSFNLPAVTARPFNTFGPRQSMRAVIPTIMVQCLQGKNVKLGSLTPTRDMNYVDNTVAGFMAAAANSNAVGGVFNLGSGREISIGELARTIIEISGKGVEIETDTNRMRPSNSEVERLLANSSLARETLGWQAEVSLEDGLQRTMEWVAANIELFRSNVYSV